MPAALIRRAALALLAGALVAGAKTEAQTPEQSQLWEEQHARAVAEQQQRDESLGRERAARKADPMAWVRSLDPMTAGGWEFRAVAGDGSWAAYATRHQIKRSGNLVTAWLRQEYAEPQAGTSGKYLSAVERIQYDCVKDRSRTLVVIFYTLNNIQGGEQSEEADVKTAAWNPIVPGTRDEMNFSWACGTSTAR